MLVLTRYTPDHLVSPPYTTREEKIVSTSSNKDLRLVQLKLRPADYQRMKDAAVEDQRPLTQWIRIQILKVLQATPTARREAKPHTSAAVDKVNSQAG